MIPQYRPLWWRLLHPIKAYRIYQKNKVIFERMRLAALEVCQRLDGDDFPKHLVEEKDILNYFQQELQKAFFKAISEPGEAAP